MIIGASCIRATPRASLCFCPPDSVEGCCLRNGVSSRASRISSAACFRSGLTSEPVVSSSSKSSPKSWLSKSWGIYQTFPKRLLGLQCFPNKITSPDFSFKSPANIRPMVLLPVPLGPIRAITSPWRHWKSIFFATIVSPKEWFSFFTSRTTSLVAADEISVCSIWCRSGVRSPSAWISWLVRAFICCAVNSRTIFPFCTHRKRFARSIR